MFAAIIVGYARWEGVNFVLSDRRSAKGTYPVLKILTMIVEAPCTIECIGTLVTGGSIKFVDAKLIIKEGCEDANVVAATSDKDLPGILARQTVGWLSSRWR